MGDKASLKIHSYTPIHGYPAMKNNQRRRISRVHATVPTVLHRSPLLEAAVDSCNPEAVQMLLEKGEPADIHIGNEFLIHRAVARGNMKIVKLLIRHGAKVDSLDKNRQTPLFTAVIQNNVEMVKLLLKLGASLDVRDKYCKTIFEVALNYDERNLENINLEIYKDLINFGFDVNALLYNGGSIISRIINNSINQIIDPEKAEVLMRLLLENGAQSIGNGYIGNFNFYLHMAVHHNKTTLVRILLEYGVNFNMDLNFDTQFDLQYKNVYDGTALTLAAKVYFKAVNSPQTKRWRTAKKYSVEIMYMFLREVAKLQETKKEVVEKNLKVVKAKGIDIMYDRCVKEIGEMKNEKIVEGVSYFDLIIAEEYRLASYIRNVQVKKILRKAGYKTKFPIYADLLEARIKMGKARNKLLSSSPEFLKNILNFKLPDDITHEIFNYLKSTDLRVLPKVLIRHRR